MRTKGFWESSEASRSPAAPPRERSTLAGGSYAEGSMHSDTLVRWNTAKELHSQQASKAHLPDNTGKKQNIRFHLPDTPPKKQDVRFNLPEINFDHDDGSVDWMPNESVNNGISFDESLVSPDFKTTPRADSVATHILDSDLARTDHMIRLRKQAKRERRALKESGDYLGVQGVNPETGHMDVETPTDSDESQPSAIVAFGGHTDSSRVVGSFQQEVTEKEQKIMLLKAREDELRRMEKNKQEATELANQLMWRRHTKEWSIVKDPVVDKPPGQQLDSPAKNANDPRTEAIAHQLQAKLIDLEEPQVQNSSCESLASTGQNDQESCGTVVRTPHQRSLADVSRAALELFENGISFDYSLQSKRAGHVSPSKQESSGEVSPTSQVPPGQGQIRDSRSQHFLGKQEDNLEVLGGMPNKPGHRTATRKAFRELTNSLRTKKSLTNIIMESTQTRIHSMTKKHILRREDGSAPEASTTVDVWVDNVAEQTVRAKTTPPSLPTIKHQEPLQIVEDVGRVSIRDIIRQDMSMLRNELQNLEYTRTGKENEESHNIGAQARTASEIPSCRTKKVDARDESACTHITITTGSLRLKAAGPSKDCVAPAAKKHEKLKVSCPEKKSSVSSKTGDIQATTPKDTTSAVSVNYQQGSKQHALKTTRAANRLQLRQKKADMVTPSTESKLFTANQSQTESQPAPKVTLKVAYIEERKKKRGSMAAVLSVLTRKKPNHCDGCSECLRIPGSFPEHLIEDAAIAPRSVKAKAVQAKQMAEAGTVFDCTLGPFVAVFELYCKVIWPVFDPYSTLWKRHAKKKTTALDVVVLVLAVPAAIAAIALAVWGLRVMKVMGGFLCGAAMAFGSMWN